MVLIGERLCYRRVQGGPAAGTGSIRGRSRADVHADQLARSGAALSRAHPLQSRRSSCAFCRCGRLLALRPDQGRSFLQIKDNTFFLFREEYKVPLLPSDLAAYLSTIAEHVFPVLLVVGLASRLSALGLMAMTLVIQLFVYPDGWPEHILWFALLLVIVARGPGAISLDHLIWSRAQPELAPAR